MESLDLCTPSRTSPPVAIAIREAQHADDPAGAAYEAETQLAHVVTLTNVSGAAARDEGEARDTLALLVGYVVLLGLLVASLEYPRQLLHLTAETVSHKVTDHDWNDGR